ncbi:substrate-binding domain-containing protein [Paenibacillus harenae]|uniref:substrate-binding domain-containing protein n=1 Tax=Paenibacillus harenae TaxID=306543 RepID=UPI00040928E0|nr:substrate-binding domain-containing protein [Paenibacillus harenae]
MSNRKWNIGIAVLFLLFACFLLSFLFSTVRIRALIQPIFEVNESMEAARHVVFIAQELDNPYWRSIEAGARDASRKYGFLLDYEGPYRINPEEQIKLLEKAIASKVDAVLLQGLNDPRYRSVIDTTVSQGIPVITVDTDEPGSKRLTYVGTDNYEAGKRMGELVAEASSGQGVIAALIGNEASPNQQLRLNGFREVIGRYPGLAVAQVRSSNISRLQAASETEDILSKYPKVGYLVGFSALDGIGMLEAAERTSSGQLRIFAFDDLEETLTGIREGKIMASIVQQPYEIGREAIVQLDAHFQGKKLPKQLYTPANVLNRRTVDDGGNGDDKR